MKTFKEYFEKLTFSCTGLYDYVDKKQCKHIRNCYRFRNNSSIFPTYMAKPDCEDYLPIREET